jgi:hypothetical protein
LNNILILGRDYPYDGINFYLNKYGFHPQIMEVNFTSQDRGQEEETFRIFFDKYSLLKDAGTEIALDQQSRRLLALDAVIYHSVHNLNLAPVYLYGRTFRPAKRFCNNEACLYVFMKKRNSK